jgi:hypothetical protein
MVTIGGALKLQRMRYRCLKQSCASYLIVEKPSEKTTIETCTNIASVTLR